MDKLVSLRAFVKVVELGSFSDAERQLRLSRSAVSKYIADLEKVSASSFSIGRPAMPVPMRMAKSITSARSASSQRSMPRIMRRHNYSRRRGASCASMRRCRSALCSSVQR